MVVVGVLALVVPLLLAFAAPVSAATRCVNTGGTGGCYGTIQAAVNAANGGDVINVYPGTYDESVNVSAMNSVGSLTLVTVNAAGVPTPGTVTVDYHLNEAEFYTNPALNGDLTIDGFVVHSAYPGIEVEVDGGPSANRNVVIRNVTATETEDDGIRVSADGDVTISNCLASDNDHSGIHVARAGGDVVIKDSTANGNGNYGILVDVFGPASTETGVAAGVVVWGDISITNCTANGNGEDGFFVAGSAYDGAQAANASGGNVTITNCTANGNVESGFDPVRIPGQLTIQGCIVQDNEEGVDLDEMSMATGVLVNGNIICGNDCSLVSVVPQLNAEGNWWGCPGGPGAAGCDPICQYDSILVDFTPWIDAITGSASADPATVGQPTLVTFQFSGGPPAVYLGQGPGDLRGPAPFAVSTDNGTVASSGFIGDTEGRLTATLTPEHAGTATV
jgi:pectinesterase